MRWSKNKPKLLVMVLIGVILFSTLNLKLLNVSANPIEQSFSDVHNEFWARTEVTQLVDLGIINGYPDKQFRPSIEVNRGQAANLLAAALKLPDTPYQPLFKDISEKSSYLKGAMATSKAGIFKGKENHTFGAADSLTREQMATVIVRAFELEDTGEAIHFKDDNRISESHKFGVKVLAQHGITGGKEDGTFDPKAAVNRATFAVFLHRAMVTGGLIEKQKAVTFKDAEIIGDFKDLRTEQVFTNVPISENTKTYLRTAQYLQLLDEKTVRHQHTRDIVYTYGISGHSAARLKLTKREIPNGDYFLFTELKNPQNKPITVDIVQVKSGMEKSVLRPFSRHTIKRDIDETFGLDSTTYPTGILEQIQEDGKSHQQMIGKSYRSRELNQTYPGGGHSVTRELFAEREAFSNMMLGRTQVSVYTLESKGNDLVDQWFLSSSKKLFEDPKQMNSWMQESAANYRKRNKWYTAQGPYNKMATTIEPLPKSKKGYGRNLLLVKEDRVLKLYEDTKERYFEDLLYNSLTNLDIFRGDQTYWETEVTSTYLKSLYGFSAPFVDTRFNEQIALFLYRAGKDFGHADYNKGLKNYADLLVSQKSKGNIISVGKNAYYISDYFPVNKKINTHTSMNHLLGGMNILLLAYEEFGDAKYLETASHIQAAIAADEKKWIRSDGDIWYKIAPDHTFVGRDYVHLTLEDLIHSYEMWSVTDPSKLPVFERMIKSKAGYLDKNNKGYTTKMKAGLERIDMLDLLPSGIEHTDAL